MKKLLYILAGITLVSAISCTKEESMNVDPAAKGEKLTLSVLSNDDVDTKMSIGEKDGAKYPLLWNTGDVIAIYSSDVTTTYEETEDGTVPVVSGKINGELADLIDGNDRHSGTFQTARDVLVTSDEPLVIVYPGNSATYTDKKITVALPKNQVQRKENSSADLGNYALGYATTTLQANQTDNVSFALQQKTAFVKVTLSTSAYSSLKLSGVKLYSKGAKLSGTVSCDVTTGALSVTNASDEVGVSYRTPVVFDKAQTLYFTTLPCDLTGQDTYLIVTMIDETNNSTVTIPAKVTGGKLEESCLTVINLDNISASTNTNSWYEPVETRYIADFGNGWAYGPQNCYVAYFDGDAVTFDVKARGNFAKCVEPKYVQVYNACEYNSGSKDNLYINGTCAYNDAGYVEYALGSDYKISVAAKPVDDYTGYSSKVFLLDKDKNTIWCFNIWGNKDSLTEQTYTNGVMLDRHIGSTHRSGTEHYQHASFYQWGRPFQSGWSVNSGPMVGLFQIASTTVTDLSVSAANPEMFMASITNRGNGDWFLGAPDVESDRATRIDDLWGNQNTTGDQVVATVGTKSIYDPCPEGYMVPSPKLLNELVNNMTEMITNATRENAPKVDGKQVVNFMIYTLPDGSKAYWPFAGCKWEGGGNPGNNTGDICSCWSNSTIGSYATSENRPFLMNYRYKDNAWKNQFSNRAHGHPIRCMKDVENR